MILSVLTLCIDALSTIAIRPRSCLETKYRGYFGIQKKYEVHFGTFLRLLGGQNVMRIGTSTGKSRLGHFPGKIGRKAYPPSRKSHWKPKLGNRLFSLFSFPFFCFLEMAGFVLRSLKFRPTDEAETLVHCGSVQCPLMGRSREKLCSRGSPILIPSSPIVPFETLCVSRGESPKRFESSAFSVAYLLILGLARSLSFVQSLAVSSTIMELAMSRIYEFIGEIEGVEL